MSNLLKRGRTRRLALVGLALLLGLAPVSIGTTASTVPMVRAAIADHTEPSAKGAEVISTTALPREWRWSVEPITFDHMFRHSEPLAVADYTRDLSRTYYSSSSE